MSSWAEEAVGRIYRFERPSTLCKNASCPSDKLGEDRGAKLELYYRKRRAARRRFEEFYAGQSAEDCAGSSAQTRPSAKCCRTAVPYVSNAHIHSRSKSKTCDCSDQALHVSYHLEQETFAQVTESDSYFRRIRSPGTSLRLSARHDTPAQHYNWGLRMGGKK